MNVFKSCLTTFGIDINQMDIDIDDDDDDNNNNNNNNNDHNDNNDDDNIEQPPKKARTEYYLPIDTIQKVPLHCIIPPYIEEGQVRSFRNGRESMSFTNYISCQYQEVGARGGKMNCVIVGNSQIRFLKNNMLRSI
jgi:hypothetical protein